MNIRTHPFCESQLSDLLMMYCEPGFLYSVPELLAYMNACQDSFVFKYYHIRNYMDYDSSKMNGRFERVGTLFKLK